jgi:hypothetical protein
MGVVSWMVGTADGFLADAAESQFGAVASNTGKRGGEGGGEGVCIFAGHLFWLLLGGEGPSPALTGTRRTKDRLTSPGAFGPDHLNRGRIRPAARACP